MDPGEPFTPAVVPLLDGFVIGLTLIIALGPQGLFVLRQGLARQHLHIVFLLCSLSDVALITSSIAGSLLLTEQPWLSRLVALGGAAFLLWYGLERLRAARMPAMPLASRAPGQSWHMAALSCLAVTWLNPAVYSDTLVIGGLAARHAAADRLAFGSGACLASIVFFCALGYGARLLVPLFARPQAWRSLELLSGVLMWVLALKLIASCARS